MKCKKSDGKIQGKLCDNLLIEVSEKIDDFPPLAKKAVCKPLCSKLKKCHETVGEKNYDQKTKNKRKKSLHKLNDLHRRA